MTHDSNWYDAFGDPRSYASHVVSVEDPEETQFQCTAERYSWSAQPAKYRLLVAFGGMLAFFATYGWLMAGESYTLMAGSLLTMPMVIGWFALVQLRNDSRNAGRPGTARRLTIAWAVSWITCVVGAFFIPENWNVRIPLPPLVILGLAMAGTGWWLGDRWLRTRRRLAPLPRDAWLERLQGLLEGRYRLPTAKAKEFRAEATTHLAESGGDPEQEFGPVDDYAAELADRSGLSRPRQKEPLWFVKTIMMLFCIAVTVVVVVNHGLFSIRTAIIAGITLVLLLDLLDLPSVINRKKRIPMQAGRR